MITYERLWRLLSERKMSKYSLVSYGGIPASTITSLRHNKSVTISTIDKICNVIGCRPEDILDYTPEQGIEGVTISGRKVLLAGLPTETLPEPMAGVGEADDRTEEMVYVFDPEEGFPYLAENLRSLIGERHMSAAALSRASGIPRCTISNIIGGRRDNPRCSTVFALARALGVTMEELCCPPSTAPLTERSNCPQ